MSDEAQALRSTIRQRTTSQRPTSQLVHEGRLHAVIDWAGICRVDPARDLMAAWTLFAGESRAEFRRHLEVDDRTWRRAKGWALTRIFNVAYYENTNPVLSLDARRTIAEVLRDH